jgi:hypothetical protein
MDGHCATESAGPLSAQRTLAQVNCAHTVGLAAIVPGDLDLALRRRGERSGPEAERTYSSGVRSDAIDPKGSLRLLFLSAWEASETEASEKHLFRNGFLAVALIVHNNRKKAIPDEKIYSFYRRGSPHDLHRFGFRPKP